MDSKFAGMDGDGDKSSSPCKSLKHTHVVSVSQTCSAM